MVYGTRRRGFARMPLRPHKTTPPAASTGASVACRFACIIDRPLIAPLLSLSAFADEQASSNVRGTRTSQRLARLLQGRDGAIVQGLLSRKGGLPCRNWRHTRTCSFHRDAMPWRFSRAGRHYSPATWYTTTAIHTLPREIARN